jgi:hypothetical protein
MVHYFKQKSPHRFNLSKGTVSDLDLLHKGIHFSYRRNIAGLHRTKSFLFHFESVAEPEVPGGDLLFRNFC